jgi:hypothetical protein
MAGVSSSDDCENLPDNLKAGCKWRFDWFQDASFPRYSLEVHCTTTYTNIAQRKLPTHNLPRRNYSQNELHPQGRQGALRRGFFRPEPQIKLLHYGCRCRHDAGPNIDIALSDVLHVSSPGPLTIVTFFRSLIPS